MVETVAVEAAVVEAAVVENSKGCSAVLVADANFSTAAAMSADAAEPTLTKQLVTSTETPAFKAASLESQILCL